MAVVFYDSVQNAVQSCVHVWKHIFMVLSGYSVVAFTFFFLRMVERVKYFSFCSTFKIFPPVCPFLQDSLFE